MSDSTEEPTEKLAGKSCKPCEGGVKPLDRDAATALLNQLIDWELTPDAKTIQRSFRFKNYYPTMAFVNAVAWIAHQQDHHPELEISYNRCVIHYSTHAIGGLSENDFICAAKIDALLITEE
jgi:4a-hydroxytetrahydrobiopterin dehydratase